VVTVKGNRIQGGSAPSTAAIAAGAAGSGTVIAGNEIIAGTSTASSGMAWGIAISSTAVIDRNRINVDQGAVGTCTSTAAPNFCGGILSTSSTTVITNNVILGVKGPRTCAVYLTEMEKAAGTVVLNANTLDGSGVGATTGGLLSAAIAMRTTVGTTAIFGNVRNNILLGGGNKSRYGIYEETVTGKTARPAVLDNNDFWYAIAGVTTYDFAFRAWSGSVASDITFADLGTQLAVINPTDNLAVDPLFGTGFHLSAASPLIDEGTSTEAPPADMDGDPRPQGSAVDIGADEVVK
jgi:hypothetical protein